MEAHLAMQAGRAGPPAAPAPFGESASPVWSRAEIAFRRFIVKPGTRQLLRDGRPVEIGGRAFDLLMVLLASRGSLVSKAQIFRTVWTSLVVHEGNLRFQMTSLRKLLGEDRDVIKTVPGRGYLFVSDTDHAGPPSVRWVAPAPLAPAWRADRSEGRAGPLIIVVDTDGAVCESVAADLRSSGFRVQTCQTVEALGPLNGLAPAGGRMAEPPVTNRLPAPPAPIA